jgi:hypothetical protein
MFPKLEENVCAHLNLCKCEANFSLCLTEHNAMKVYWGVELQLHPFLTSALGGG